MKPIQAIEVKDDNREELLPDYSDDFPYIASRAELHKYPTPFVPWHWHRTVKLFYVESGTLEYTTVHGKWIVHTGWGGMVNANVLHCSSFRQYCRECVQLLHLFDPVFLAGKHGSRIETKYILPLTTSNVEMVLLSPEDPAQAEILDMIRSSFRIDEQDWGYELKLRGVLSQIWLKLHELAQPSMGSGSTNPQDDDRIKRMMVHIHEHYPEPISVEQLAQTIPISKRACFRLFQEKLHMSPAEYMRAYRLQRACQLLINSTESVTHIAYSCGLGSSSYFGKVFRDTYGCTPLEYRKRWHDCDSIRR